MILIINNKNLHLLNKFDSLVELKSIDELNPFINYIIYIENKKILGFLKYQMIYERMEIDNIFVNEKHRNKKIGSKMMEELINIAKKEKIINITLEVKKDNQKAINLYKKYGFTQEAIRERYYNGIDGILMKKEM